MRVTCPYSGVVSVHREIFSNTASTKKIQLPHPIFSLPTNSLLSRAKDLHALSFLEQKLILLALLNRTEHVRFTCPANPDKKTIFRFIAPAMGNVVWMNATTSFSLLPYPTFVVNSETADLRSLGSWLLTCQELRAEYQHGVLRRQDHTNLLLREEALYKLINSPYRETSSYSKRLASWCMTVIADPEDDTPELTAFRMSMFTMNAEELGKFNPDHLKDFIEHVSLSLEQDLSQSNIIAFKVLEHLRNQLRICNDGPTAKYGGGSAFQEVDLDQVTIALDKLHGGNAPRPNGTTPIQVDFVVPTRQPGMTDSEWTRTINSFKMRMRIIAQHNQALKAKQDLVDKTRQTELSKKATVSIEDLT